MSAAWSMAGEAGDAYQKDIDDGSEVGGEAHSEAGSGLPATFGALRDSDEVCYVILTQ